MYKNLECMNQFTDFLAAASEDIGFNVISKGETEITLEDKNGSKRELNKGDIAFIMGATVGIISKILDQSKVTKDDQGRII